MADLTCEGVTKTFPLGVTAVRDLSLHAADGELVSGRSVRLRQDDDAATDRRAGEPTAGTIRLGGKVVNQEPPQRRDVAMVFQRPALYPHLSVRDNLAFGLRLARPLPWGGVSGRSAIRVVSTEESRRVAAVAELLGLTALLGRRPRGVVGRRAAAHGAGPGAGAAAGVLLLDEPLSNLDARLRMEMRRELHLLRRRFRATMIYVTHDQEEALTLGDRIAVLDRGVLQQVDSASALLEQPANRFVAGFLGSPPMNLLDGELLAADGGLALVGPAGSWSLANTRPDWRNWSGRRITLGLRPEWVTPRPPEGGGSPVFEVRLVERLASGCLVILEHDGWRLSALMGRDDAPAEGQALDGAAPLGSSLPLRSNDGAVALPSGDGLVRPAPPPVRRATRHPGGLRPTFFVLSPQREQGIIVPCSRCGLVTDRPLGRDHERRRIAAGGGFRLPREVVNKEVIFSSIEKAVRLAIHKRYDDEEGIAWSCPSTASPASCIAQKGEKVLAPEELGRIAAQAAKQMHHPELPRGGKQRRLQRIRGPEGRSRHRHRAALRGRRRHRQRSARPRPVCRAANRSPAKRTTPASASRPSSSKSSKQRPSRARSSCRARIPISCAGCSRTKFRRSTTAPSRSRPWPARPAIAPRSPSPAST